MPEAEAAINSVAPQEPDLATLNRDFYNRLWNKARFVGPERFNTWPLMQQLAAAAPNRLEIGPGLRPRLPIEGTHFLDISEAAVTELSRRGGTAIRADATSLPYPNSTFDLICALDIIEHVPDEDSLFRELVRVLRDRGTLVLAIPMNPDRWTSFDAVVGHARRYTRDSLQAVLKRHGLSIERSAAYGMQSQSSLLLRFTVSGFTHMPRTTIFIYNNLVMPLGLALQKPLQFQDGLLDTNRVDEVLLICRKGVT